MNLTDITEIFNILKFCPVCGKELEIHPVAQTKSCFLHGDFSVTQKLNWDRVKIQFKMR